VLGLAQISVGVRVVVQQRDGAAGHPPDWIGLGGQPAQDPGAPLGGLEHQQHRPRVVAGAPGHGLDRELVALQLELGFDGAFERIHHGNALLGGDVRGELEEQGVAVVLDVGHHPVDAVVVAGECRRADGWE